MKKITLLILFFCWFAKAQTINDYKYVIVPSKFSFFEDTDEYRLNTLTKLLLGKYGFQAYLDTDPEAKSVRAKGCDNLYADVLRLSGFMATKLVVQLKDCGGNILYATEEGRSKEKDFNVAYTMALRDAFESFDALGYKYNGDASAESQVLRTVNNGSEVTKEIISSGPASVKKLTASVSDSGYDLLNSESQITMKLLRSSASDIFIGECNGQYGVVYKRTDGWYFDYYVDKRLVSEKLTIQF